MKITVEDLRNKKTRGEKIVMLTSYDYISATIENEQEIDIQLIGDSVGTNVLGYQDVSEVTIDDITHHVRAVARGASRSFVLADMPYGSFATPEQACRTADRCRQCGADGVKMEGEFEVIDAIASVVRNGMPVCGHIGYTPQSDGPRASVQGKDFERARELVTCARAIQDAGACMLVLELIPEQLAAEITALLEIPTISIGAGRFCDGQVQVIYDIAGISSRVYRHAKAYDSLRDRLSTVIASYRREVIEGTFPTSKNASSLPEKTLARIHDWLSVRHSS